MSAAKKAAPEVESRNLFDGLPRARGAEPSAVPAPPPAWAGGWYLVRRAREHLERVQSTRLPKKELEALREGVRLLGEALADVRAAAPELLELNPTQPEPEELEEPEGLHDFEGEVCGALPPGWAYAPPRRCCALPPGHKGRHEDESGNGWRNVGAGLTPEQAREREVEQLEAESAAAEECGAVDPDPDEGEAAARCALPKGHGGVHSDGKVGGLAWRDDAAPPAAVKCELPHPVLFSVSCARDMGHEGDHRADDGNCWKRRVPRAQKPMLCDAPHPVMGLNCSRQAGHVGPHEVAHGKEVERWEKPAAPADKLACALPHPTTKHARCALPEGHEGRHECDASAGAAPWSFDPREAMAKQLRKQRELMRRLLNGNPVSDDELSAALSRIEVALECSGEGLREPSEAEASA